MAVLASVFSRAQITATASTNATVLAQSLAGNGVTISNATLTAANGSSGSFSANNNTNLGISSGVVLTTGRISDLSKAANAGISNIGASFDNGTIGDAQLTTLSGYPTYNASSLTFNVVPIGDKLTFRYVFMSEEYPDFVCANYNDVFGFFVNGPRPAQLGGGNYVNQNVAIVPNSNQNVGINTVNSGVPGPYATPAGCPGSNTAYYRTNASNAYIVYNGGTVVLTATIDVIPCATYTFKLAVADGFDEYYDSGVFIEAGSFTSNRATINTVYSHIGYNSTYEGCSSANVQFNFNAPYSGANAFKFQISGSATNGVDYQFLPDSIVVPQGATSATISIIPFADNIAEGSETVVISLVDACTLQPYAQTTITINDTQNVSIVANNTQLCSNESAQLTALGTVAYSWFPTLGLSNTNSAVTNANPPADQIYTVTGTTGNCISTASINIQKSNLSLNGNAITSSCGNNGGASIILDVTNGKPNYSFLWSDGATTKDRSGLSSGTYIVTVTDAFNCTQSQSFTIQQPTGISISGSKVDATCANTNNGSITLNVAGGAANYSFLWNDGGATQNRSNLAPGNYSVVVTDANNCSGSASFTIQANSTISVASQVSNATCGNANGSAILNVSGGNGNYSFNWSNGAQSQNLINVIGGNYQVTVSDNNACSAIANVQIGSSNTIQATISSTNVACHGGQTGSATAIVNGNGNFSFAWSNGQTGAAQYNLSAGNYTVTVSDANQCSATASVTITEPAAPLNASFSKTDVSCGNALSGSAQILVSGGSPNYSFTWNVPNISGGVATGLAAGNYDVTITDANNCTAFVTFIIEEEQGLSLSATTTPVSCNAGNDGIVNISATGGNGNYSFIWSNTATSASIQNLSSGIYSVTVTDGKGCSASTNVQVTEPLPISIFETHSDIACNSLGSIDVNVSGGNGNYQFMWSDNVTTQNRNNLTAGNYSLVVVDAKQCSAILNVAISNNSNPLTINENIIQPKCFSELGSITLNVSGSNGNLNFIWSDGFSSKDRNNLTAGNYSVTVADNAGCSATKSFNISEPELLKINAQISHISCNGNGSDGSISLTVSGGVGNYSYKWNDNVIAKNRTNLSAGNYSVTVHDGNNCSAVNSFTLQNTTALLVNSQKNDPLCFGSNNGSISLLVSGGDGNYSFIWSNNVSNSSLASNLSAGLYSVTITDGKGCTSIENFSLSQPDSIQLSIISTPNVCFGSPDGTAVLTASGGVSPFQYSIKLLNSSSEINRITNEFTELSAGSYIANVKDNNGCFASANFTIAPAQEDSLLFETKPTSCFNASIADGSIAIIALSKSNVPYEFSLNGNAFTNDTFFNGLKAGNYVITSKNNSGCVVNHQVKIDHAEEFFIELPADTINVEIGHQTALTVNLQNINNAIIEWNAALQPDYLNYTCNTCSQISPVSTTPFTNEYEVKVYNQNNSACFKTAKIVVNVANEMVMPNAFTPNGDGLNDRLYPIFNNNSTVVTDFRIYNSWGQMVHNDASQGWDGNFNAQAQPNGTYTYFVSYQSTNHATGTKTNIQKTGNFVIVK